MYKSKVINFLLLVSFTGVILLPLYTLYFLSPAYDNLIKEYTESSLIKLASQMVKNQKFDFEISENSPLPDNLLSEVERIRQTVGLSKVKIFTPEGWIVYSSDPADIGDSTSKIFFNEMIIDGKPRSLIEISEDDSGNGTGETIYQVETYVPIKIDSKTIGAFEIYMDITDIHNSLIDIKANEQKILFPIIFVLFLAVFISAYYANRSVFQLHCAKEKFKALSRSDGLTGLLNRRGFVSHIKKQLIALSRSKENAFLIYIDLDNLKWINDQLGHKTGDEVICETARIFKEIFRETDIIARLGGDEFAIFTVQTDNPLEENSIRARIEDTISRFNDKTENYKISLSMGFALYSPDSPCSGKELLMKADNLMYEEKCHKKLKSTT